MSVLVQRPHQMPGVIVLPRHNSSASPSTHRNRQAQPQRHHTTNPSQVAPAQVAVLSTTTKPSRRQRGQLQQPPSTSSPHRSTPNKNDKRRSHQSAQQQPTAADSPLPSSNSTPSSVSIISGNSSSSATVSASHSPVLSSSASPVNNNSQATTTPPRKGGRQQHQVSPKSAPNTPSPVNALPVPANRRRARSPRPTQKLPGLNLDELLDDDFGSTKKNHGGNNKKAKAATVPATNPEQATTWQQAALLMQSHPAGMSARAFLGVEERIRILTALIRRIGALVDPITVATSYHHHTSHSNPPSPTRTTPPKGSVFAIANEYGLTHSSTMPNLSTPNRRPGGMHSRAPSVPSYSTFPPVKPVSSLDALFSGLTVDSAPVTPAAGIKAGKAHQHTRGQSVSSSLPPSTSLHARMAAAAAATTPSSASRRERTLTGNNNAGYIKFAGASFQAAPDAMMLPRPAFGGMLGRRGGSHSGSSDEDDDESSVDEHGTSLSEEGETGVFPF
ncbi:hypothetical protein M407DRAFT_129842 [Tulasnella calospora MUT 4182]|uniref:Uncharacterized protein n=1 Tax=Tulasnella calospora MUT 4182 TaxID=1051891 RepID=A0A0C3LIL1_9AGAM|nr:hypothetical protein M407DRAFT_129842 [Tulasnella calospora MUT 4182]